MNGSDISDRYSRNSAEMAVVGVAHCTTVPIAGEHCPFEDSSMFYSALWRSVSAKVSIEKRGATAVVFTESTFQTSAVATHARC